MITDKKDKGKSRCAVCMSIKSFFDKKIEKYDLEVIVSQFL